MKTMPWANRVQQEIDHAEKARHLGNEGMARVCARRAAGLVLQEYFRRQGQEPNQESAYRLLQNAHAREDLDPQVKEVVGHFTVPITFEHDLPIPVDLIAEVLWLARELLGAEFVGRGHEE